MSEAPHDLPNGEPHGEPDGPQQQEHRARVTWDLVMAVLAFASLLPVLYVEVLGLRWPEPRFQWIAAIDLGFVLIFAGDLVVGLRRARDRGQFLRNRWYELPGLVPLYLEAFAFLRVAQVLRLTRLLRLLRTFGALRRTRALKILDKLINRHKVLHTALVTSVVVVALATTVWLLERDTNPSLSDFGDAMWWAIVTTTTVGYGDITPQTGLARLVATGLMLLGIGLIAVLASSFSAALISTDAEHAAAPGLVGELERLAALRERGHLSDDEFTAAKRRLLGDEHHE
jgi:voltage-gated potassium channel